MDFKIKFADSILKSKADKSHYQYDALSIQESFFVDCKLKYLIIKSSGELTDFEQLIEFENDSIKSMIEHKIIYKGNDNGKQAGRTGDIEKDTIFITDFKMRSEKIYITNKLKESIYRKKLTKNRFIYKVKENTETNYSCR